VPYVQFNGQRGRIVDYATGDVVSGTTVSARVIARPLDRLELEARFDRDTLEGTDGKPHRLTETARQFYATWHFTARMYALLSWQEYTSMRAYPDASRDRSTLAALQFNWDVSRDLQAYWGVRSGSDNAFTGAPGDRGSDTEVYMKLAYTLRY
jgi:hypothetical protein